jgi:hypothetical protein
MKCSKIAKLSCHIGGFGSVSVSVEIQIKRMGLRMRATVASKPVPE